MSDRLIGLPIFTPEVRTDLTLVARHASFTIFYFIILTINALNQHMINPSPPPTSPSISSPSTKTDTLYHIAARAMAK